MWYVIKDDELYHHGIKGQKWGIRRFQNPDGTLTAEGKKRYNADVPSAEKRYNDALKRANYILEKNGYDYTSKDYIDSYRKAAVAKNDLATEKIKEKLNARTHDSKSFDKLKAMYAKNGMSDEEAAVAAYKRQRAEKIFAAAAVTAASAAIAYAAYRHFDRDVDKIIPEGTLLQRVSVSSDPAVHDAFYAARSKGDADTYVGMYGTQIKTQTLGGDVYQKQIRVNQDIRLASEKNAASVLSSVASDDDITALKNVMDEKVKTMLPGVNATEKQLLTVLKARHALKSGKINSNVYDAFNYERSGGGDARLQPLLQKFDSELKKRGYGGIADINDKRLSGYNTKTATIIIDSGKVSVDSVRKLSTAEITAKNVVTQPIALGKEAANDLSGVAVVGFLSAAGVGYVKGRRETIRNDNIVEQYRKEHPGTKLSYTQIVRNYEKANAS